MAFYHLRFLLGTGSWVLPVHPIPSYRVPCEDLVEEQAGALSEDKRQIVQEIAEIWYSDPQTGLGISIVVLVATLVRSVWADVSPLSAIPCLGSYSAVVLFTSR